MADYVIRNGQLYHHGIKGMRWGVRRFQDKNGRLTAAGKKRYNQDTNGREAKAEDGPKKSGLKLTDKQKKAIKIGAAVCATALVAYGGYKVYQHYGTSKIADGVFGSLDPKTGLEMQANPTKDIFSNMKAVNPNFSKGRGYQMNCGNCGIAFEARMRGYDVEALRNVNGMKTSQLGQFFKNMHSDTFKEIDVDIFNLSSDTATRGKQVEDAITKGILNQCKNSKDARGILSFPGDFGGHFISWVKNGDSVQFVDSQNPDLTDRLIRDKLFPRYVYHRNSLEGAMQSIRLDDLEFNGDTIRNVIGSKHLDKIAQKASDLGLANAEAFDLTVDKGKDFVTKWM